MAERTLPEASFAFALDGAEAPARVVRAQVTEALSAPYECAVELAWEPDELQDPEALLGRRGTLTIARDGHARRVHGVVVSAEHRGAMAASHRVDLVLAPALALLGWRRGYRIFQGVDALAIVRAVFEDAGVDFALDASRVGVAPLAREYCVQYDETDLAFVARLLAEEGLHYAFTQGESAESLVVFDGDQASSLGAAETYDGLPVQVLGGGAATADREGVVRVAWRREVGADGWRGLDYDFTHPQARVEARAGEGAPARGVTEYPARMLPAGWDGGAHAYRPAPNPRRFASRRLEGALGEAALRGEGTVIGFSPGAVVEVADAGAAPRRLLVTRVVHLAAAPEQVHAGAGPDADEDRYANHFEAVALDRVPRPARRARPRVSAPHVAVVTRDAGSDEEIVTDRYGRVLVRFFWDDVDARTGAQAGTRSSCWLRVAQSWAGPGWGFNFIPRVGMEVIVHFLDGDPDRPFVAGCLPNATNAPPVELPQHRTQSAIRTQSSPASGGYNELRFEDLKDAEEVYLRAQRDQRVEVLHDRALSVGRDAQATVERDESLSVGRDRSIDVMGNEQHSVEGDRQLTVGGDATHDVSGALAVFVKKSASLTVDEKAKATINDGLAVFVGGSSGTSVELSPDDIKVQTPKRHVTAVGDEVTQELTKEKYNLKAPRGIALVCGDTRIELGEDRIVLQTKSGAKVELNGDKITIKTDGPVNVKGSNVSNNG